MSAVAEYTEVMRDANIQVETLAARIDELTKELAFVRSSRDFWRDAYQRDIAQCLRK